MSHAEKMKLSINYDTSEEVLRKLVKDKNPWIRGNVAYNPKTPEDALRELAKDENWGIRSYVAKNPKSSTKILVALFEHEKTFKEPKEYVIRALYENKNLPAFVKKVIETLFGDML